MRILFGLVVAVTVLSVNWVQAESLRVPGYEIHYSVLNTGFLLPEIAARYGVVRGKDRALINVAVRRIDEDGESSAVPATVEGTRFDLIHKQALTFQEVLERDAIYYLASFSFLHRETLYFKLLVQPQDAASSFPVEFSHTLYHDDTD